MVEIFPRTCAPSFSGASALTCVLAPQTSLLMETHHRRFLSFALDATVSVYSNDDPPFIFATALCAFGFLF